MLRRLPVFVSLCAGLATLGSPSALEAADGTYERVVVLGDSYSSGQGIHADASDYDDHGPVGHSFDESTALGGSACHREADTTPGRLLARRLGVPSVLVACAGARIEHITNQLDVASIPGDGSGTLVTITVGGNDLRTSGDDDWPDVLIDCVSSSRCDRDGGNQPANLGELLAGLTNLYTTIGREYPAATVRVLGYPRLMQRERWGCPGVIGVGRKEADWIDEQVDRLNAAVDAAVRTAARATSTDLAFVPVVDEFDGHGACRLWQRDRYVNDRLTGGTYSRRLDPSGSFVDRTTDTWVTVSGASFHPSQKGYDAYSRALGATL